MKKVLLYFCLSIITINLFAEIKISTNEIKVGIHYSIDTSVNIRKFPSLSAEKIGKVNLGDKIEVLEKTEVYFESEGIYDCFYKIKFDSGIGYMFGGYISDNTETLRFDGNEFSYFDKLYNYKIKLPKRISSQTFYKYSENNDFIRNHYQKYDEENFSYLPKDNKDYFIYIDFAYESPSLEELISAERILKNEKEDFKEFSFSKAMLFATDDSTHSIIKKELVYYKISDIKILKNQFSNTAFISYKLLEIDEPYYVDATEFVTLQNGEFKIKRRCANYARDGIYSAENTFIFPNDNGGEKNTIRITGKYIKGNEITEEYDERIFWNGKDFVEKN